MKNNNLIKFLVKLLFSFIVFFSIFGEKVDSLIYNFIEVDAYELPYVEEIPIEQKVEPKPLSVVDEDGNILFRLNADGSVVHGIWAEEAELIDSLGESNFKDFDKTMYTKDNINFYKSASSDSEVLKELNIGTAVFVSEIYSNEWCLVHHEGILGFINLDSLSEEQVLRKVSSTAYWDKYNRTSASGRTLVEGKSIAGKIEWLGKYADIYACNDDGTLGDLLGTYRFDDTGYGAETGYGDSIILEDKSIGTIENGTCIDFYRENESDCWSYGRRDVYIVIKN